MHNENDGENQGILKKIGGILFLLWFIGNLIGIPIIIKTSADFGTILILAGQFFLVFAIIVTVGMINDIRKHKFRFWQTLLSFGMLVISVGLLITGILGKIGKLQQVLNELPELVQGRPVDNAGLVYGQLFMAFFFILSLILLIGTIITRIWLKHNCTKEISAVCIELRSVWHSGNRERSGQYPLAYAPIFQYVYNNHVYESCDDIYVNVNPVQKGESVILYIDPEHPERFYNKGTGFFHKELSWAGILLSVISLAVIFILQLMM